MLTGREEAESGVIFPCLVCWLFQLCDSFERLSKNGPAVTVWWALVLDFFFLLGCWRHSFPTLCV